MNELEIVEWVRRRSRTHFAIVTGVGDDMAVLRASGSQILLSSDLLLDGVHFISKDHSFLRIGRKAVARALSDCAAMAVNPTALLVSAALPSALESTSVEELFEGIHRAADQFGAGIAGGDTAKWEGPLAIDIAVLAEPFPGIAPVLRNGAKVGDRVCITGSLGGSILGKHLDFVPRIREAKIIAQTLGEYLHAMMDISDGLTLDLWRMCEASGVGAKLDEILLQGVISDDARRSSAGDGKSALEHAMTDGEDYELLVAVAPQADLRELELSPIGTIVKEGLQFQWRDSGVEVLRPGGWIH